MSRGASSALSSPRTGEVYGAHSPGSYDTDKLYIVQAKQESSGLKGNLRDSLNFGVYELPFRDKMQWIEVGRCKRKVLDY